MSVPLHQSTPDELVERRRRILPKLIGDVEAVLAAVRLNPYRMIGIGVTTRDNRSHIECDLPTAALASMLSIHLSALQRELSGSVQKPPAILPDMSNEVRRFEVAAHVLRIASAGAVDDALREIMNRAATLSDAVAISLADLTACMEQMASSGLDVGQNNPKQDAGEVRVSAMEAEVPHG